jgi:hypothetical protein
MRRVTLVLLALCFATTAVEARAQVTLGLKGGLNISNLSAKDADGSTVDFDSRTVFTGGAYLQAGLGSVLALQAEALYSPRGANDDGANLDLTYFDLPLLVLIRVPAGDSAIWPILYAGPVLSFETKCRLKGEEGASLDCGSGADGLFRTKNTDVGVTFGGGFEVFMGSYTLQLDGRYNLGLVDIDVTTGGAAGSLKNRTWSFYVGLGRVLSP